jgi:hypothetical protein
MGIGFLGKEDALNPDTANVKGRPQAASAQRK